MGLNNLIDISLTPGHVNKSHNFKLNYVTVSGQPLTLCRIHDNKVAFTTLRSPSGTGKSTLLQRFVEYMRNDFQGKSGDLSFFVSNRPESLSIGKVPQSPTFVRHWGVKRFLPKDSWAA